MYIEERFLVCNELDRTIYQNIKKPEAPRRSILKQAFKVNLTDKWRKGIQMKISKATALNDLKALVRGGFAEQVGRGRSVRYAYKAGKR